MGVGCFWPEVGVGNIIVLRQMFLIFFIPTTSLDQCPLSMHLIYANSEHWLSGGNITHSFLHAARLFAASIVLGPRIMLYYQAVDNK